MIAHHCVCALSTTERRRFVDQVADQAVFVTLVHPSATVLPSSISTTLNIYDHVVEASHRKAVEAVEERLFGELDCLGLKSSTTVDQPQVTSAFIHRLGLEAPPGFEPGVEVLQTGSKSLSC